MVDALWYNFAVPLWGSIYFDTTAKYKNVFQIITKLTREHSDQIFKYRLLSNPPAFTSIMLRILDSGNMPSFSELIHNFQMKQSTVEVCIYIYIYIIQFSLKKTVL